MENAILYFLCYTFLYVWKLETDVALIFVE